MGSLKLSLSCYEGSPIHCHNREEERLESNESIKNLDYLKSTLCRYCGPINSINRRLEEIKNDLSEKLSKQNNSEISIDNMLKCTDTIKQMIRFGAHHPTKSTIKEKKSKESSGDDEEIKSVKSAKYHYQNICKILKGSKLIILNKFYNRFYINKSFYGGLNEEEELSNLANRFEINLKDLKLYFSCKKLLD